MAVIGCFTVHRSSSTLQLHDQPRSLQVYLAPQEFCHMSLKPIVYCFVETCSATRGLWDYPGLGKPHYGHIFNVRLLHISENAQLAIQACFIIKLLPKESIRHPPLPCSRWRSIRLDNFGKSNHRSFSARSSAMRPPTSRFVASSAIFCLIKVLIFRTCAMAVAKHFIVTAASTAFPPSLAT